MRSAFCVEWIIARLAGRTRAAAIVGDLLEARAERGTRWFRLSVAGIIFSLVWRRPLAFVAAFFLGLRSLGAFEMAIYGLHATHRLPEIWMPLFGVLSGLGMLLWMAAPYAAIRYGFRDRFTQIALAFCGLITVVIFCWWISAVAVACIALALSVFVASVVSVERRRALLALVGALAFGFCGGMLLLYLEAKAQEHSYHLPWWVAPPIAQVIWRVLGYAPLLAVWIMTTSCSRMHGLLSRRSQLASS
jgi:hypothetical protein